MSSYLDNAGLTNVLVKIKSLLATKASITAIPTKVSSLENDSGYQTSSDVASAIPKNVSTLTNDAGYQTAEDVAGAIPKNVSAFTNDSGYLTNASLSVPTKVSELENDSGYQTASDVTANVFNITHLQNYNATDRASFVSDIGLGDGKMNVTYSILPSANYSVTDGKYISSVTQTGGKLSATYGELPTKVSEFENDSDYVTNSVLSSVIASVLDSVTSIGFLVVNELPAKPENGVIYLVPHGTYDSDSVSVNHTDSSGNTVTDVVQDSYDEYIWVSESTVDGVTTYNYEKIGSTDVDLSQYAKIADVPTKVSQLTNDSGYLTNATLSVPTKTSELENDSGFVTSVPTKVSELENDSGYLRDVYASSPYGTQEAMDEVSTVLYSFYADEDGIIRKWHLKRHTVTDTAVDGQYVSAVSQKNDKISVTRKALPSVNDTATSGQYVSSVSQSNGAISVTRANLPSFTDTAVDGKYVSSVSQSGGKITVTRADLPSGGSSDTPIPNETIDAMFTEVFG